MANWASVTISDRLTDANAKTLPRVGDLSASWELSRPGLLSFSVSFRELIMAGLRPDNLLGKWVRYVHPTLGMWGGMIMDYGGTDGLITISAESWAAALRGFGGIGGTMAAPTALTNSVNATTTQTGISATLTDMSFNTLAVPWFDANSDLLDTILSSTLIRFMERQITNPTNRPPPGWVVDPTTRKLRAKVALGTDRTATVKFADKVNVVSSSFSDDLTDVYNAVRVAGQYYHDNYLPDEANPVPVGDGSCATCNSCSKKKKGKKKKVKSLPPACPVCGCATLAMKPGTVNVPYADAYVGYAENTTSIQRYGKRYLEMSSEEVTGDAPGTVYATQAQLNNLAQSTLSGRYDYNRQLVTVELAPLSDKPLLAAWWTTFDIGDVVAVDFANSGIKGSMVVRVKAVDLSTNVLTVSGEADLIAS